MLKKRENVKSKQSFKLESRDRHFKLALTFESDKSLRCPHEENLDAKLTIERTAKTDQTGQMHRLTGVFAGRTGQFDGFVVLRLS